MSGDESGSQRAPAAALAAATDDRIAPRPRRHRTALRQPVPRTARRHVRFAMKARPLDERSSAPWHAGAPESTRRAPARWSRRCGPRRPRAALRQHRQVRPQHHRRPPARRPHLREHDSSRRGRPGRPRPGARVFCRVATGGAGAVWGLSHKFGCSPGDAVHVMERAWTRGWSRRDCPCTSAPQQMTGEAWRTALEDLGDTLRAPGPARHPRRPRQSRRRPARARLPRPARHALDPPLDKIFAVIREGTDELRRIHGGPLDLVIHEPGWHLVADLRGDPRRIVARLTWRRGVGGERQYPGCT